MLATSFDIICLQETWLLPNDLSLLNTVIPSMSGSGISAVDLSDGILCGRPCGGVAFLCQKALCYNVNYVNSGYDWCYAVTLSDGNSNTLTIINLYLPCDTYTNVDLYLDYLGKLEAFISDVDGPYLILGDFNNNPQDNSSPCGKDLRDFVSDSDFVMFDSCLPIDSYTYLSDAWHSTSWLVHCIGPKYLLDSLADCRIIYDSFNSDHLPLSVSINIL